MIFNYDDDANFVYVFVYISDPCYIIICEIEKNYIQSVKIGTALHYILNSTSVILNIIFSL